jgi:hypothetical protein
LLSAILSFVSYMFLYIILIPYLKEKLIWKL